MPEQKDWKRLVRARMKKTGESYTTARAQILRRSGPPDASSRSPRREERDEARTPRSAMRDVAASPKLAELAGMSDDAVRAKTGRDWAEWVRELDARGAVSMPHRDIARLVHESYGVPDWWTQTVAVGYERIRGLREIGQRRGDGSDSRTFEASKSKTFAVSVSRVYRAFSHKATRERWLPGVALKIRTSTRDKSMRITWPDGTSVHVYFVAKGPKKSQVALQHVGLSERQEVTASKEYWTERLEALFGVL